MAELAVIVDNGVTFIGLPCADGDPVYVREMYELNGSKWKWYSVAPDSIPAGVRLNFNDTTPAKLVWENGKAVPSPSVVRFRLGSPADLGYLYDPATYKTFVATVAITRPDDFPVDHCARVSGFTEKELTDEVRAWRAAVDLGYVEG